MSIDLMLEVMDHAPTNLTSGERLVLLVIAERANEKSRVAEQSSRWTIDTLAHRAGVLRSGLKSIFQGLAKKGCEVRIPIKFDKRGKPVFAFEGTAMTFKIPNLVKSGGHSIPSQREGQDHPSSEAEGMPQHPRGEAVASERGGHSHPQSLKTLKEPSNFSLSADQSLTSAPSEDRERDEGTSSSKPEPQPQHPAHRILAKHGIAGKEADSLIPVIERQNNVRTPGFYPHVDSKGDMPAIIAAARAELDQQTAASCNRCGGTGTISGRSQYGDTPTEHGCPACTPLTPDAIRVFTRMLDGQPDCPHGYEGGNVPMPDRGWMSCATCRAQSGYVSVEVTTRDQQPRSGQREGRRPLRNSHDNVEGYFDDLFAPRPSTGTQRFQQAMDVAADLDATFGTGPPISEAEIARRRARGEHVPYFDPADPAVYNERL